MIFSFSVTLAASLFLATTDATLLYQRGSYRHVADVLLQAKELSWEDQYRLIQSLLMIEHYDEAWERALSLSFSQKDELHQFLVAFLASEMMQRPLPTNQNITLPILTSWLKESATNPFFSTNLIQRIFYTAYTLNPSLIPPPHLSYLTPLLSAWQNFSQGDSTQLQLLLSNTPFLFISWQQFTNTLINLSNLPSNSYPLLWSYLARLPAPIQNTLASNYIPLLPPSSRWNAEIEYALAKNQKGKAITILENTLASKTLTTIEDFQKAIAWANRLKSYSLTEQLAQEGIRRFGSLFHSDYAQSLIRQKKKEQLFQWYEVNETNIINQNVSLAVFRLLIENRDPRLLIWLRNRLQTKPHPSFFLTLAIFELENNRTQKAYELFLELLFDYPFTYEWCVATDYEKHLRQQYNAIFTEWYTDSTNKLSTLSLQQRLLTSLSLAFITGNLPFPNRFSNDLAQYQKVFFETHLSLTPTEKSLFNQCRSYANTSWTNFPRELSAYIDTLLQTPNNRLKFSWYGYDLYTAINDRGIAISRLDYLTRRYTGREGIILLPYEMQTKLFPIDPIQEILPVISNTNNALWVLAAYRQESHFRKHVESSAGAYGYAQLMPSTARLLARNLKQPELHHHDYDDNILLGNTFYAYLLKKYEFIPYALAAYNAGEGAVNSWKRISPLPLWIESIPYQETRDYVKVIYQQTAFYRFIYREDYNIPLFLRSF